MSTFNDVTNWEFLGTLEHELVKVPGYCFFGMVIYACIMTHVVVR